MGTTLKEIWKNRSKIVEGIKNSIIRDEFVEEVATLRHAICNECGCSLGFKTRSLVSDCPLGKWEALATVEEEDVLDNLKN